MVLRKVQTPYWCRRVNPSTFLIIHNDKYEEYPFIYVKLPIGHHTWPIILLDTGCGPAAATSEHLHYKDLRDFLRHFPVAENGWRPLAAPSRALPTGISPIDCSRQILVVNTHCHYDHIGGNASFDQDPQALFLASGYDKQFLDDDSSKCPEQQTPRAMHSLCKTVGMDLPGYNINCFLGDGDLVHLPRFQAGGGPSSLWEGSLVAIHTPGHTPDSLSLYDKAERVIYTGDLFYRRKSILPDGTKYSQAIMFPAAGDWRQYMRTLYKLREFVQQRRSQWSNHVDPEHDIYISCSHTTAQVPALGLLKPVIALFEGIISGAIGHTKAFQKSGELYKLWQSRGKDPDFTVVAPARLLREMAA